MKKNLFILLSLLPAIYVSGQQTNQDIVIEKDAPILRINNTSTGQYSSARLAFQNTESANTPVFSWHLEKSAAGAGVGDNCFFLREYYGSDWLNYISFYEANHNIVLYSNKSSGATYGNFIVNSGNVGIGTISPSSKLHVAGGAYFNIGEGLQLLGSNSYYGTDLDARIIRMVDGNGVNAAVDGGVTFESFTSSDGISKDVLTLRGNGNVGVGTIRPSAKLDVNGNIRAERIDVISDVPASDYVFDQGYDLRPLPEVEQFVKTNRHLPEVPSAEEFKENGYSVGEMDDILLRKVEELTLYVIELKKEIEELKQKTKD